MEFVEACGCRNRHRPRHRQLASVTIDDANHRAVPPGVDELQSARCAGPPVGSHAALTATWFRSSSTLRRQFTVTGERGYRLEDTG